GEERCQQKGRHATRDAPTGNRGHACLLVASGESTIARAAVGERGVRAAAAARDPSAGRWCRRLCSKRPRSFMEVRMRHVSSAAAVLALGALLASTGPLATSAVAAPGDVK